MRVSVSQIVNFFFPYSKLISPKSEGIERELELLRVFQEKSRFFLYQQKLELRINDVILVGVPDFILFDDEIAVVEVKDYEFYRRKAYRRAVLQLGIYSYMFSEVYNYPYKCIVQYIYNSSGLKRISGLSLGDVKWYITTYINARKQFEKIFGGFE